jgi:hypothetical protein
MEIFAVRLWTITCTIVTVNPAHAWVPAYAGMKKCGLVRFGPSPGITLYSALISILHRIGIQVPGLSGSL